MEISRRGTLFGLLALAGAGPTPGLAEAFDLSIPGDLTQEPDDLPTLFGSRERVIAKPEQLLSRIGKVKLARVNKGDMTTALWLEMVEGLRLFSAKGQIAGVNSYLNSVENIVAISRHGRAKAWAKPLACLGTDGQSEDYALAKFMSLRRLGVHRDRLRIVWVEERHNLNRHAVLAVMINDRAIILEDRFADITMDTMLPEYRPYCSINQMRFSLHWDPDDPKGVMASFERLRRSAGRATA